MWWEWWEKQKTNIQQISRTPTSCGSFSMCYFEDAKRQATGPDKFGQSMVTSHSFSPPILDHQVAMLRPSTFYQLPGDWSQTWASFGIQKLVWFIEFFSFDLGKSSFRVLQGSTVSWLLGWSPLFLSIPHATGVFNFRMGLLYFGRWKECKIHGFLHSLLLRWSRDFKPGWELDGKIAMAAGRVRFGMFHHCWCEWIGLRNILQKKHTYFTGKNRVSWFRCFPWTNPLLMLQSAWRALGACYLLLLPSRCRAVARKSTTSPSPRPRKVTFWTANASGACPDSEADRAFSANSFLGRKAPRMGWSLKRRSHELLDVNGLNIAYSPINPLYI